MSEQLGPLLEAVRHMAAAFGQDSYALVGGLAVGIRGRPRGTIDADFIVAVPRIRLPAILETLAARGFTIDLRRALTELRDGYLTRLEYQGIEVDLIGAPIPAYQQVIELATWEEFLGTKVRVASAEGLIFLKLAAFRPQDQADLWPVLAANLHALDMGIVRGLYAQVGQIGDDRWQYLERIIRELDEEASRG